MTKGLLISCLIVVFLVVGYVGLAAKRKPHFHNDATKKFYDFAVRKDNKMDGKEVYKAFQECFPVGLPFSEVEWMLSGGAGERKDNEVSYRFVFNCEFDGHVDGFVLTVVFSESPGNPGTKVVKESYGTTLPS